MLQTCKLLEKHYRMENFGENSSENQSDKTNIFYHNVASF